MTREMQFLTGLVWPWSYAHSSFEVERSALIIQHGLILRGGGPKDNRDIFLEGEWKLSVTNNSSACPVVDAGYLFFVVIEFSVLIGYLIIRSFKINKQMDDSINMNH